MDDGINIEDLPDEDDDLDDFEGGNIDDDEEPLE